MHNGTLTAFEKLQPQLLNEMPSQYRDLIRGQTDSECIFYWLMFRLYHAEIISGQACFSVPDLRHELAKATIELNDRNQAGKSSKQESAKLNFMLTNGSLLVGTRFDNSLWYQARRETPRGKVQSWLIASEPTIADEWIEIPNRSVFSLNIAWRWHCDSLGAW